MPCSATPSGITRRSRTAKWEQLLAEVRNSEPHAGIRLTLEFMVLTATRSNEVRDTVWDEIEQDVWTIPVSPMTAKQELWVSLSCRALEILEEARQRRGEGEIVFRVAKGGRIRASMSSKLLAASRCRRSASRDEVLVLRPGSRRQLWRAS